MRDERKNERRSNATCVFTQANDGVLNSPHLNISNNEAVTDKAIRKLTRAVEKAGERELPKLSTFQASSYLKPGVSLEPLESALTKNCPKYRPGNN